MFISLKQSGCAGSPECCFGFEGKNVRGEGRVCKPYVAKVVEPKMVEETDTVEKTRKLLAN